MALWFRLPLLLSMIHLSFQAGEMRLISGLDMSCSNTHDFGGALPSSAASAWKSVLDCSPQKSLRLRGGAVDKELEQRLQELINQSPVMLFMKGSPDAPQCGFSKKTTALLQKHGIKFGHFDILQDEAVRQGLKEFSNWPTYPQVYKDGELVGGLDVLLELEASGELAEELTPTAKPVSAAAMEKKIAEALDATLVKATDESDALIERQRAVHAAIKDEMSTIHALTLR